MARKKLQKSPGQRPCIGPLQAGSLLATSLWWSVPLLLLLWPAQGWSLGEEKGGYPNFEERANHYFVNRARVDPTKDKSGSYSPAPPLRYHHLLNVAARFHADHIRKEKCWCRDHSSCCVLVQASGKVQCSGSQRKCGLTTWSKRYSLFGMRATAENMYSGSGALRAFQAWVRSSGHWKNMINAKHSALGAGILSTSVQGFGRTSLGTNPLFSGHHYSDSTTPTFGVVFYSTSDTAKTVRVVFSNVCQTLLRVRGKTNGHAAFEKKITVGSGCQRYYFQAETSSAQTYTYPSKGSLAVGSTRQSSCALWSSQRHPIPSDSTCGPNCRTGQTRPCYSGPTGTQNVGLCRGGIQTCRGNQWGSCVGEVTPTAEKCGDHLDNDCDGKTDEGCTTCQRGQTRPCYTGPAVTRNVGLCKDGVQTCQPNGSWGPCSGQTLPRPEQCDGLDNNCNGRIDETFPEKGQRCAVPGKQGECAIGTYTACQQGKLVCTSTVGPITEICGDGKDNDCDGKVDEGCTTTCKNGATRPCYSGPAGTKNVGICKAGTQTCTGGKWGACTGQVLPQAEKCNDKLDNDCDGKIDEGCTTTCKNGATQPCYTGPPDTRSKGECKDGTQTCTGGKWGACAGQVLPLPEVCRDGKDNDCDGSADENCPGCQNGDTRSCYNGPKGTQDVGTCKAGTQTCTKGKWSNCQGQTLPAPEVCNDGLDNDCNGAIDNGCVPIEPGDEKDEEPTSEPPIDTTPDGSEPGKETVTPDGGEPGKETITPEDEATLPDGPQEKSPTDGRPGDNPNDPATTSVGGGGCSCQTHPTPPWPLAALFLLFLLPALRRKNTKNN